MFLGYCIVEIDEWNNFNWPKGIVKHRNDLKDMHYLNEGKGKCEYGSIWYLYFVLGVLHHLNESNACVNWLDMILSMCP